MSAHPISELIRFGPLWRTGPHRLTPVVAHVRVVVSVGLEHARDHQVGVTLLAAELLPHLSS